jgi:hypothetical protein
MAAAPVRRVPRWNSVSIAKAAPLGYDVECEKDNKRAAQARFYTAGTALWSVNHAC